MVRGRLGCFVAHRPVIISCTIYSQAIKKNPGGKYDAAAETQPRVSAASTIKDKAAPSPNPVRLLGLLSVALRRNDRAIGTAGLPCPLPDLILCGTDGYQRSPIGSARQGSAFPGTKAVQKSAVCSANAHRLTPGCIRAGHTPTQAIVTGSRVKNNRTVFSGSAGGGLGTSGNGDCTDANQKNGSAPHHSKCPRLEPPSWPPPPPSWPPSPPS